MTDSPGKALVRRWFHQVWNEGNIAAIDELLAPQALMHGLDEPLVGPAQFKPFYAGFRAALPDITFDIEDMMQDGDKVALRWTASATHKGDGLGVAPTNKRILIRGLSIAKIANGMIVEAWNAFDQLPMMLTIGAAQMAPAPSDITPPGLSP